MGLLSMARAARSKSTRDTDSTSAGAEAQPPIPAECFECSRCMEACSNADLAPACKRGGKTSQSCWRCLAAYKGLTRRWRKNRKLQTWFQQKTAGEKAEWYKQHKTSMAGQRNDKGRRIIEVRMESFQEKKHSAKRRIHWKPFHIYRRDLMASGVTDLNQVQAMWRADLMNSANKLKQVAGQWCIGEFLGEIEDFEEAEGNRSSVDKKQVAEDEQEMSELIKELGDTTRASASAVDAMLGEVMAFPSGDDVCDIADEYVKDPITTVSAASLLGFDTLLADMAASDDMVSKLNELYLEEELDAQKCALPTDDRDESMLRSELLKLVKVHLLKVRGSLDEHDLEAEHISSHGKVTLFKGEAVPEAWQAKLDDISKCKAAATSWVETYETNQNKKVTSTETRTLRTSLAKELAASFEKDQLEDHDHPLKVFVKKVKETKSAIHKYMQEQKKSSAMNVSNMSKNEPANSTDGPGAAGISLLMQELKADINIKKMDDGAKFCGIACYKSVGLKLQDMLKEKKAWETYYRWFDSACKKEGRPYMKCGVPKAGLVVFLRKNLTDALPGAARLMERKLLMSAGKDLTDEDLYSFNLYRAMASHTAASPLAFGMAECRFLIEGSEFILGVALQDGTPLNTQKDNLVKADCNMLRTLASTEPNFAVKLDLGQLVVLPTGFIYVSYNPTTTHGVRWSFSTSVDGEDARVVRTVARLIDACPALRAGKYQVWHDFLAA